MNVCLLIWMLAYPIVCEITSILSSALREMQKRPPFSEDTMAMEGVANILVYVAVAIHFWR